MTQLVKITFWEGNRALTGQEVRVRLPLRNTSTTSVTSLLVSLGKIGQVKWSVFS